jgi:hypothetical protein
MTIATNLRLFPSSNLLSFSLPRKEKKKERILPFVGGTWQLELCYPSVNQFVELVMHAITARLKQSQAKTKK